MSKKIILVLVIFVLNMLNFINSIYAANLNSANIYLSGDCGQLLKYKGTIVKVSYVEYNNNGTSYPAYCLNKNKPGAETGSYNVSVKESIKDIGLWRRVINGYPYKTIEELGVYNKEEAFTATKQAIYCYIHGNNPDDYEAIGEAGQRTLEAMYKIINAANSSNETKISNIIRINEKSNEWKQDEVDKNYVSKMFYASAAADISEYKIKLLTSGNLQNDEIKVTNLKNIEKDEFMPYEEFKVLIPIKRMIEKGEFKLQIEGKVKTKPVLYGEASDNNYQDYALVAETYEEGIGEFEDQYPKNETQIIIVKKDAEEEQYLQGVEFELLDSNKNVVYTGLKTDEKGNITINNIVPGKYYLSETATINGYNRYEQLIEINLSLHEQITVDVLNNKEERPKISVNKSNKNKEVKKLPVTGM